MGNLPEGERSELLELYKIAVDEYHFEVQLGWSRAQYLLAFNAAVLATGAGLQKLAAVGGALPAGVFLLGAAAAGLSIPVTKLQHEYYRRARDRMKGFERDLGIAERGVDTTPGMRGEKRQRLGKVVNVLYLLFGLIVALDVAGVVSALAG